MGPALTVAVKVSAMSLLEHKTYTPFENDVKKTVTRKDIMEKRIEAIKSVADKLAMTSPAGWQDTWRELIDKKIKLAFMIAVGCE